MRVLHILSSHNLSGAENVVAEIISVFKDKIIMAYTSPDGPVSKSLIERDIEFIPLKRLSKLSVISAVKQFRPDIIHAHDVRASVLAARGSCGIPVISHLHGNPKEMSKISLKSLIYQYHLSYFSYVVAVSDSILSDYFFSDAIKSKCTVLYNVVNRERILEKVLEDKESYNFDFVFVGRLTYPKNPERVIEIAAKVIERLPNVRLGIIGDGDLRNRMKNAVEHKGISNNVTFCGYMKNPYKALSQAKALLMCSRFEGTPMVALEAMLLGVPVISTPVDGLKKIIIHGTSGYLEEENEGLASRICSMIENPALHQEVAGATLAHAIRSNDMGKYKKNLFSIYNKVYRAEM